MIRKPGEEIDKKAITRIEKRKQREKKASSKGNNVIKIKLKGYILDMCGDSGTIVFSCIYDNKDFNSYIDVDPGLKKTLRQHDRILLKGKLIMNIGLYIKADSVKLLKRRIK